MIKNFLTVLNVKINIIKKFNKLELEKRKSENSI